MFLFSEECVAPSLPNGQVTGSGDARSWTGTFSCDPGFVLVTRAQLKCRDGVWSDPAPPACTGQHHTRCPVSRYRHQELIVAHVKRTTGVTIIPEPGYRSHIAQSWRKWAPHISCLPGMWNRLLNFYLAYQQCKFFSVSHCHYRHVGHRQTNVLTKLSSTHELATADRKILFISPHHHPINDQIELLSASLIMIKW